MKSKVQKSKIIGPAVAFISLSLLMVKKVPDDASIFEILCNKTLEEKAKVDIIIFYNNWIY